MSTRIKEFAYFIQERELIRQRRVAGHTWPFTSDPILQKYYFCNVEREQDKVTKWIARNWREPNKNDPDLWFALTIARNINLPETLEHLGYPVPWDKEHFLSVMYARRDDKQKSYNGAYMIRAGRTEGDIKARYQAEQQFDPLWEARVRLRPRVGDTLEAYWNVLLPEHGFGDFLAQQVVADLMYVEPLVSAEDWFTFCAPGPGSLQGLNILLGKKINQKWSIDDFRQAVSELQGYINRRWELTEPLHAQNITNCLCEYSKYKKAHMGLRVKRRYEYASA